MAELLDKYKELLYDGARLEEIGLYEDAEQIYRQIVKKCARLLPEGIDTLAALYGETIYDNITSWNVAIAYATVAAYCQELLKTVRLNFPTIDNYKAGDRADDEFTAFLRWLSVKTRTLSVGDYSYLKGAMNVLEREKNSLTLPVADKSCGTLYDILKGLASGRFSYDGSKIRR